MSDEQVAVVEAPVVEQAPVQEQVTETVAPVETAAPVDVDFSDIAPQYEQQTYQPQQQPVDLDDLADRIFQKLKPEENTPEDQNIDPKMLKEQLKQEIFEDMTQRAQAQQIINQNIQASSVLEQKYVDKLTEVLKPRGIDYTQDLALQNSANLLYDKMKSQKAASLNRSAPVLTPQETAELLPQFHKEFSRIYLGGAKTGNPVVNTQSLSPGGNALPEAPNNVKPTTDEFSQFMEKKKAGKETIQDALSLLNKINQRP